MSKGYCYAANQLEKLLGEIVEHLNTKDDPTALKLVKQCHEIASAGNKFLVDVIPVESAMQEKIVRETLASPTLSKGSGMLSGHQVGQLLKMVAEMVKAKSILEIGTYTGYGSVTLAETTFCEQLVTLDNNDACQEFLSKQLKNTPLENKIRVIIATAADSLKQLKEEGKSFDLVFIDADKCSYVEYYKYILDNDLLNPRGVILCDNILWSNDTFMGKHSIEGQALYDFVQTVKKDARVNQMIFPFRDGVMLIRLK